MEFAAFVARRTTRARGPFVFARAELAEVFGGAGDEGAVEFDEDAAEGVGT